MSEDQAEYRGGATEAEVRRAVHKPNTAFASAGLRTADDKGNKLCQASIYKDWSHYQCAVKAKHEEHGHWFCGRHAPSKAKERDVEKRAKWDAEDRATLAAHNARKDLAAKRDAVVDAAVAAMRVRPARWDGSLDMSMLYHATRAYIEARDAKP